MLALTLVVFMTLLILAFSIYAVGENIRQRIELQNAADAAAYSAAVVQADGLSRLAAINLAMGWTYVETGKRTMDYIMDKWLREVVRVWNNINGNMYSFNHAGHSCGWGDYWTGLSEDQDRMVLLNSKYDVPINTIIAAINSAAGAGKSWMALRPLIVAGNNNLTAMNQAEVDLVQALNLQIPHTMRSVLAENIDDNWNDSLTPAGGADIRYAFNHIARDCFTHYPGEGHFLRSVFGEGAHAINLFGSGINNWFNLPPGGHLTRADGIWGFQRLYEEGQYLVAMFKWYSGRWRWRRWSGCTLISTRGIGTTYVRASQVRDGNFNTAVIYPFFLTPEFFERAGALVVGLARRIQNPFQFMCADPVRRPDGIYNAFNPFADNRYHWAAAAARAGYRDTGRPQGAYNSTIDSWWLFFERGPPPDPTPWDTWRHKEAKVNANGWQHWSPRNLTETDWDAIFLPLHRAWAERIPAWQSRSEGAGRGGYEFGEWIGETGVDILAYFWHNAAWMPLRQNANAVRLRNLANGNPPPLMSPSVDGNGSLFDANSENLIWH